MRSTSITRLVTWPRWSGCVRAGEELSGSAGWRLRCLWRKKNWSSDCCVGRVLFWRRRRVLNHSCTAGKHCKSYHFCCIKFAIGFCVGKKKTIDIHLNFSIGFPGQTGKQVCLCVVVGLIFLDPLRLSLQIYHKA